MAQRTSGPRPSGRPSVKKGLSADSVAEAAFALFSRQGYDATSLDQVAASLAVTKAAVLYHHASKEAILQHGLDAAMSELEATLAEGPALAGAGSPLGRYLYVLRRGCEIGLARKATVEVLLRLKGNSDMERLLMDRRRAFNRAASAMLREAVTAGEVREGVDVAVLNRLSVGMVNSLVDWYRPEAGHSAGEVVETAVRYARAGLAGA
jgi:AcrR family transcriptional regulator